MREIKLNDYEREICREIINCALALRQQDILYRDNFEIPNLRDYISEAMETYSYFEKVT